MAEILLKVGPGSNYVDGDILCAFNDRRISCCHAEHICHVREAGFNNDGLRPAGSLAQSFRQITHQYLFRRVGNNLERHELATGKVDVFGSESIDVELYIRRNSRSPQHCIFGSSGAEYWYGGTIDVSEEKVHKVWDAITYESGRQINEKEFKLWPMGRLDIRHHLAIRTENFTDTDTTEFERPQLELDENGEVITKSRAVPNGEPERYAPILYKRAYNIAWREILPDLDVSANQVEDREYPVGIERRIKGRLIHRSKVQPDQIVKLLAKKKI